MDVSNYLSDHGHVVPRRSKKRCRGPEHCADCACDLALVQIKKHWKATGEIHLAYLSAVVSARILDDKSLRASLFEDGSLAGFNSTNPLLYASIHSQSFDILRAMEKKGFRWQMTLASGVAFTHEAGSKEGRGYRPKTGPVDICLAALEALGVKLSND